MGCKPTDHDDDTTTAQQPTCEGYELMADLDFDTDGDGDVDSSDTYPNWTPIGTTASPFTATFKGNSHSNTALATMDSSLGYRNAKISNLTISAVSSVSPRAGLFGATGENARIEGVGLVDVNIDITTSTSYADVGALVAYNAGKVIACYSTGKISVAAGNYSEAGGLVGYNKGTIAAAFSRATVYMSSSSAVYVGGLTGYNGYGGTITAAYAAGAVKGKGDNNAYVAGLVGYNVGSINASYSVAPVTSVGLTTTATSKPAVLGLSYNEPTAGYGTVTVSYWDSIRSGVSDDADDVMPEGKTTAALTAPTNASGIYADWDDLTIGDAIDVDPWIITGGYPVLSYRGLAVYTIEAADDRQGFASLDISSRYGGNAIHPQEGMTLKTIMQWGKESRGSWIWETSTDGITWTTLVPSPGERSILTGANSHWLFVPRSEHVGKHIRARIQLGGGGYGYTRVTGKIKVPDNIAGTSGFASGHNPPRVGTAITVSLPSAATVSTGLWYRCDSKDANPPSTGCELVGSRVSYIPGVSDLGHHLHAYIYYKNSSGTWIRASTGFTQQVVDRDRASQWRGDDD